MFAFYMSHSDTIGDDIVQALQQICSTSSMLEEFAQDLIYIIPKASGISSDIRKWRPTSPKIISQNASDNLHGIEMHQI